MITVLFFAHLKETLGYEGLHVEATYASSVALLRQKLADKGEAWAKGLACGSTLVAVNQTMAKEDAVLNDGDEVAFFPPVTGG
ncbi:MAG: molybdopterin converting factor subunit 1 [Algicola sp.]|nr:molybdopterin converting factor subunit 1 [Algicola sp.]